MSTTLESNGTSNGHIPQSNVDDHFAYFRSLYDSANQSWYLQKMKGTYDYGKQTFRLENVLNPIEDRVAQASNVGLDYAAPLYANYVYPKTDYLVHKFVVPGVENSKVVLEKSKHAASAGGTYSLNLAVLAAQVGLLGSAAMTALLLDGIILSKNTGVAVAGGAITLEKAIEQRILNTIERSRNLAKVPVEKFNEFANSFIDILNAVLDNHLHLPIEEETEEAESSNVAQRVHHLARRVLLALKTRTNENLVQPVQNQLKNLAEQLQKSLHLVDVLKQQRHHLKDNLSDLKTKLSSGQVSESVNELWGRVQAEASEYKITPEEALIRSIKRCSFVLNDYLKKLRQQTNEILPASASQRLDAAANYVEELNSNLENSKDIYGVKDEILQEATRKLNEISSWTSSFVKTNGSTDSIPTEPQANDTLNNSQFSSDSSSHDSSIDFS